jgi:hypothetical protein
MPKRYFFIKVNNLELPLIQVEQTLSIVQNFHKNTLRIVRVYYLNFLDLANR